MLKSPGSSRIDGKADSIELHVEQSRSKNNARLSHRFVHACRALTDPPETVRCRACASIVGRRCVACLQTQRCRRETSQHPQHEHAQEVQHLQRARMHARSVTDLVNDMARRRFACELNCTRLGHMPTLDARQGRVRQHQQQHHPAHVKCMHFVAHREQARHDATWSRSSIESHRSPARIELYAHAPP